MATHILTLSCADAPGIVAKVSTDIFEIGGNILDNAQFGDAPSGQFCMRTTFSCAEENPEVLRAQFQQRTGVLGGVLRIHRLDRRQRLVIMVSKLDHCLLDLLYRWRSNELKVDIEAIVSNHRDLESLVRGFGLDFHFIPVSADTKQQAETRLRSILAERNVDLVVLARYMQILSDDLCTHLVGQAINIHHSFLPAFKGAGPYQQAWQRGVKLIGATAHYVTTDLDEGPIINQGTERVNHAATPADLATIGRDVERIVLSGAVRAHVEGRVFLLGNRTVVFP